jgi:hypothetical protein
MASARPDPVEQFGQHAAGHSGSGGNRLGGHGSRIYRACPVTVDGQPATDYNVAESIGYATPLWQRGKRSASFSLIWWAITLIPRGGLVAYIALSIAMVMVLLGYMPRVNQHHPLGLFQSLRSGQGDPCTVTNAQRGARRRPGHAAAATFSPAHTR